MATDHSTDFGHVSRLRGAVFEAVSFGAALLGIVALAILLAFVTVDALGLDAAAEGWILTVVATVVAPTLALVTYGLENRQFVRRAAVALVAGVPVAFGVDLGLASVGLGVPKLDWALLYLFGVVLPVTGAVSATASESPAGSVAMGFLGRIVAGTLLGAAILILFVVVEPQLWFLVYTLGVLPFVVLTAYGRRNPGTSVTVLRIPAAILGTVAAVVIHGLVIFYTPYWALHVWSLALPAAVAVAIVFDRSHSRQRRYGIGAVTFLALVGGSLAVGTAGVPPSYALFLLLGLLPAGLYASRASGIQAYLGLSVPLVILAGALLAWLLTDAAGLAGPQPWLDWQFLTSVKSSPAELAGFYPAIVGSVVIIALVALLSFAFGVGTAVFLEEYTADEGWVGTVTRLVQVNIANLAAVPSVVYGLLGLAVFANLLGLGAGTIVTASLTLSLLILPITIISAQEAIRSVPDELRRGSDAMGATRWQTTKNVVLPEALPGIFTGTILALGRAIGETAPLILIGAASSTTAAPSELFDTAIAMPLQLFAWYSAPGAFREGVVPAGVVTLLAVLLVMNGTAIVLRNKYEHADG